MPDLDDTASRLTRQELDRVSREMERLAEHSNDCDKRVSQTELLIRANESEINSLRASRHEHANWMSRLSGEIREVNQRVGEIVNKRLCDVEAEITKVKLSITDQQTIINELVADAKVSAWKIGFIIGALIFVLNQVASRIKIP